MPPSPPLSATARALALGLLVVLAACADRRENAAGIAAGAGFQPVSFDAPPFTLAGWQRGTGPELVVYIEGDGLAWLSKSRLSDDPTPRQPMALQLAAVDPAPAVLYLGRPCQYVENAATRGCGPQYWSSHRFAPEVIAAVNRALDQAKLRAGAGRLVLIGYSGGGAVAALAAARRQDVAAWATVAAPLDHVAWTRWHGVTPLTGSLDPMADAARLAALPQRHFVGATDDIVPPDIVRGFLRREASGLDASGLEQSGPEGRLVVVPETNHQCCWVRRWPALRPLIPNF